MRGSTSVTVTKFKRMGKIGNLLITSLYSFCASVIASFDKQRFKNSPHPPPAKLDALIESIALLDGVSKR